MPAQKISLGSLGGRLGSALGEGIAQSMPKGVEQGMLAGGLQRFMDKSQGMTPLQRAVGLYGVPGVADRPQLVKSLGDLALMEAQGQAAGGMGKGPQPGALPPTFQQPTPAETPRTERGGEISTLVKPEYSQAVKEPYIPKSQEQIQQRATELYQSNPDYFKGDFENALAYAEREDARAKQTREAERSAYKDITELEDRVTSRLRTQAKRLGVLASEGGAASLGVPEDVYNDVESQAIADVRDGKLNENQAAKKAADNLNQIARRYAKLSSVGNWGITLRNPLDTISQIKGLQKPFAEADESRHLADNLMAQSKLGPKLAYAFAEPLKENAPAIARILRNVPNVDIPNYMMSDQNKENVMFATMEVSERIGPRLKEGGSPLAVAYELDKKGYDGRVFLDYVRENAQKFNLTARQMEQLAYPGERLTGNWNDWWLGDYSSI